MGNLSKASLELRCSVLEIKIILNKVRFLKKNSCRIVQRWFAGPCVLELLPLFSTTTPSVGQDSTLISNQASQSLKKNRKK